MTPPERDDLADRIMRTWPRMLIPPDEWRDVLGPLDAGTAGTAFVRLRNNNIHPPSIAEFLSTYRALPTAHNQPIRNDCPDCAGDGFTTITEYRNGETYPATFKACHCREGSNAQRQLDEALAHNDRLHGHGAKDTT